jgi:HEPN domain-containing protein
MTEENDAASCWPTEGDRLFVESAWAYNAQVVSDPGERYYRLPKGYYRAADILIEHAIIDVTDRPNIIYAALFCYRQAIEVSLKQLISEYGDEKFNTHNLSLLWKRFVSIAIERNRGETIGLIAAQSLVTEMHDADRRSDGFRYPADMGGAPFLFGDRGIDLENLRLVMHGLINFLECANIDFSHQDSVASD